MKRRKQKRALQQDLNVTNLVDVTFAILVVFMITAPLMSRGIQVELPKTNAPSLEEKNILRVSLNEEGDIYLDKQKLTLREFSRSFPQVWDGESAVAVNSDSSVAYGRVMQVVGTLQDLGVRKVGFLTRSPGKAP